jgi:hypothetical protein
MNEVSRRPRSTAAERALWKQRFLQSGLLLREFADQHGLKLSTLQRWVGSSPGVSPATPGGNQINSRPAAPVFAEVTWPLPACLSASSSAPWLAPAWAAELVRPDGSTLRLAREVSASLLKRLLRAC